MKRCPKCHRVEMDDTLVYCREDGAALISDSGSIIGEAGTVKFGSGPVSGETETSILTHPSTTPDINRSTGLTTCTSPAADASDHNARTNHAPA